jgi:hypothetical protein
MGTVTDVISSLTGVFVSLVAFAVMAEVLFGAGTLGMNVIGNISTIVGSFLSGGLAGLITLVVLFGLWDSK